MLIWVCDKAWDGVVESGGDGDGGGGGAAVARASMSCVRVRWARDPMGDEGDMEDDRPKDLRAFDDDDDSGDEDQ